MAGKSGTSEHGRARIPGLDGLRGIAVILVVLYHFVPVASVRGYLGVDVFFVLSGFLITHLLIREGETTGHISLIDFWKRRFRRILPALLLMVGVCGSAAVVLGGDALAGFRREVLTTLTFTYNWGQILTGTTYFGQALPALFTNAWSLAVEEQFYLVWPLLLAPFVATRGRRRLAGVGAFLLALASLAWAAHGLMTGVDATRLHVGTDMHAYGLMLGSTLGIVGPSVARRAPARPVGALASLSAVGLLALSVAPLPWDLPMPVFSALASVLTAVVILAMLPGLVEVGPASGLAAVLGWSPLTWVGVRSYGVYLWHWPLMVLLFHAAPTLPTSVRVPLLLALSVLVPAASWAWLERPVLRRGLAGLSGPLGGVRSMLLAIVASMTTATLVLGVLFQPSMTSAERFVLEGAGQSDTGAGQSGDVAMPQSGGAEGPQSGRGRSNPCAAPAATAPTGPVLAGADPGEERAKEFALPGPTADTCVHEPFLPAGSDIAIIGDSVTLASKTALEEAFPGVYVDGEVSRSGAVAASLLEETDARIGRRPFVVVSLAANATWTQEWLDAVWSRIGADRRLVLVTGFGPESSAWIAQSNDELRHWASGHAGRVWVADWAGAIAPHTDLLAGDLVHPGPEGAQYFVGAVREALLAASRTMPWSLNPEAAH